MEQDAHRQGKRSYMEDTTVAIPELPLGIDPERFLDDSHRVDPRPLLRSKGLLEESAV